MLHERSFATASRDLIAFLTTIYGEMQHQSHKCSNEIRVAGRDRDNIDGVQMPAEKTIDASARTFDPASNSAAAVWLAQIVDA